MKREPEDLAKLVWDIVTTPYNRKLAEGLELSALRLNKEGKEDGSRGNDVTSSAGSSGSTEHRS